MEQKGQNVDAEEHLLDKQSADDRKVPDFFIVKQEFAGMYAFLCLFSWLIKLHSLEVNISFGLKNQQFPPTIWAIEHLPSSALMILVNASFTSLNTSSLNYKERKLVFKIWKSEI